MMPEGVAQPVMPREKNKTSFTLSADAVRLLAKLAARLGIKKTNVVELAVRRLAEAEGLRDET